MWLCIANAFNQNSNACHGIRLLFNLSYQRVVWVLLSVMSPALVVTHFALLWYPLCTTRWPISVWKSTYKCYSIHALPKVSLYSSVPLFPLVGNGKGTHLVSCSGVLCSRSGCSSSHSHLHLPPHRSPLILTLVLIAILVLVSSNQEPFNKMTAPQGSKISRRCPRPQVTAFRQCVCVCAEW